jgi:hypothetical protein
MKRLHFTWIFSDIPQTKRIIVPLRSGKPEKACIAWKGTATTQVKKPSAQMEALVLGCHSIEEGYSESVFF